MPSRIERLKVGPIGENIYAVESRGLGVLIDPGADADIILAFLKEKAIEISTIALTHGHLDHCGAIPDLLTAWRARNIELAIHPEDARYLGKSGEEANRVLFDAIGAPSYFKSFWRALPEPTLLLKDGEYLPGTSLLVMHTPGHSGGSVCFYEAANGSDSAEGGNPPAGIAPFLISGDTLFRGGVGRVDAPDADPVKLAESLSRLSRLPPETLVFPGHGPKTTIGREFPAV